MHSRETALAAVRDYVSRVATDQDPSAVLAIEALKDAEELVALTNPADDLDVAYALGMFHWFRYLALPEGAGQDALAAAVRFLAPIFSSHA